MADENLLEVKNLHVSVDGREVLNGVSLEVGPGEIHALFGPNGSGKTTLLNTVIGFSRYKVTEGAIYFKGRDITGATIDERARAGIGISFQRPPTVRGVALRSLISFGREGLTPEEIKNAAAKLDAGEFLDRDVNAGLSGGEMKRTEMLQIILQQPELVCLDEPESGVDLENMALIGRAARIALGREEVGGDSCLRTRKSRRGSYRAGLVITHTGQIMDHIYVDKGHVLMNGEIVCSGNAQELLGEIRSHGYTECFRCVGCDRRG
ncbi:ABC transporter ATP-binding protein [Synergistes jonesii]|uniref:ABC transporter ATP-binding protein n=1 Tax=Synergistes jonesii TaxID=2754 RepID=UPI00248F30CB|nr:ABC transporter ATP-binding protein [Synergistes jonesii]